MVENATASKHEGENQTTERIVDECERLQGELDALLSGADGRSAAESLDAAVGSMKENEHNNVSSVQLVALV